MSHLLGEGENMMWKLCERYSSLTRSFNFLAAKDYLIDKNGVWKCDEYGNRILPFGGQLPNMDGFDVDAMKNHATTEHEKFKTCDAFVFAEGVNPPCLIEFKDQNVRNVIQPDVMNKCWGSLVVLHKTLLNECTFSQLAKKIRLIVVFSASKSRILQFLAEKASSARDEFRHGICWDLQYYTQVGIFSSVHTWSDEQFRSHLSDIGLCEKKDVA